MDILSMKKHEMGNSDGVYLTTSSQLATKHTMSLAISVLGFDIFELWVALQGSDNLHCVYVQVSEERMSNFPEIISGFYPDQKAEHKLSPNLIEKAKASPSRCHWRRVVGNFTEGSGVHQRFSPLHPDLRAPCLTEVAYMLDSPGLEDSVFLVGFSLDVISCKPSKLKFLAALGYTIYIAACGFDSDESTHDIEGGTPLLAELDQKGEKISTGTSSGILPQATKSSAVSAASWREKKMDHLSRRPSITSSDIGSQSVHEFTDSVCSDLPFEESMKRIDSYKSVTIIAPDEEPRRRNTFSMSGHSSKHSAISDGSYAPPVWDPVHPFSYPIASIPVLCTATDDLSLEHFSDVKHIADGSNSNVFLALFNNEKVIIKMIKETVQSDVVATHEFDIEHGILSRLNHPNIIKLKGAGRLPRRFIVLEYIEGGSLYTILDQNQTKSGLAHRLFRRPTFTYLSLLMKIREIADAFRYLHQGVADDVTIIHRDLKPDNVGFSADGTLKLFDFGLCTCVRRRRNADEYYEMTGNTGSLRYMAPEVALKRSYGEQVDVYSFGILVWQMARDKVPFHGLNKESFMRNVVAGGQRPKLDKSWPSRFSMLLQSCWHTDPAKRPSFGKIYEEFDKLIDEESKKGMIWRVTPKNHGKWQTQAHESTWF